LDTVHFKDTAHPDDTVDFKEIVHFDREVRPPATTRPFLLPNITSRVSIARPIQQAESVVLGEASIDRGAEAAECLDEQVVRGGCCPRMRIAYIITAERGAVRVGLAARRV
jgi:hypothetical protein